VPVSAADLDLEDVVRAIAGAVPGVAVTVMLAVDLLAPAISGVVEDPDEPAGGYLDEQELAKGVTYIILGVGKLGVGKLPAGIHIVNELL